MNKSKREKINLIKKFNSIHVNKICESLGIYKNNLYTGNIKEADIDLVIEKIKEQYNEVFENGNKTL